MNEQKQWDLERLESYKEDMDDSNKSMKQAEKELKDAEEWLVKMKLNYAGSTIKYYQFKEEMKKYEI